MDNNPWKPSPEPNPWRTRGSGGTRSARFGAALIAAAPIVRNVEPVTVVDVWSIYCHTHVSTGRSYVGCTMRNPVRRWQEHMRWWSAQSAPLLGAAIREHGVLAFSHRVLETVGSIEAAREAEQRWIVALGTFEPDGFNVRAAAP